MVGSLCIANDLVYRGREGREETVDIFVCGRETYLRHSLAFMTRSDPVPYIVTLDISEKTFSSYILLDDSML